MTFDAPSTASGNQPECLGRMECEPCTSAAANPRTGYYGADCLNCQARAIAQSPTAFSRARDPAALQAAMRAVWPEQEKYRAGRLAVWAWVGRLSVIGHKKETP